MSEKLEKIRRLNDAFRRVCGTPHQKGRVLISQGVSLLSIEAQGSILNLVRTFDDFSEDNDSYEEHDFGAFDYDGERLFWKIDYYDEAGQEASEDASDPARTTRIMTVLFAHEW
jgi:hypothetical protein